ncbi:MAG: effector-associated domain EAD1-containing protein [Candidatus Promineifilaceae bacterium]
MSIQLQPTDFNQLRNLLANLTEFKTVSNRLDFLEEMLQHSPRKADILGRYVIDGAARGRASNLITLLCEFGQDIAGHEALNHLIDILLDYHGAGEKATFLHDLQTRYRPLTDTDNHTQPPTTPRQWTSDLAQPFHAALLGAYNQTSLERMLRFTFNKTLTTIVAPGSLTDMVFNLITVAEREGWIVDLILAAHQSNSGNQSLANFARPFM